MSITAHYAEVLLPVLPKQEGMVHILERMSLEYPSRSSAQCCHRVGDRRHALFLVWIRVGSGLLIRTNEAHITCINNAFYIT